MSAAPVLQMPRRVPGLAFMRAFFESFPGIWFIYDDECRVIEISGNYEVQTGCPADQVVGRTAAELDFSEQHSGAVADVLRTGRHRAVHVPAWGGIWFTRLFPVEVSGKRYVGGCSIRRYV